MATALTALIPMATAHLEARRKAAREAFGEPLPTVALNELADLEQRLQAAADALEAAPPSGGRPVPKPLRRPYRPSNASEFDAFYSSHCKHCSMDRPDEEVHCNIIVHAMAGKDGPPQWIVDPERGVMCTSYTEDQADPAPCLETKDLF